MRLTIKNSFLFFICCFNLSICAQAQPLHSFPSFSDSALWSVAMRAGVPPVNINTQLYSFSSDTFFCGFNYSIIESALTTKGYVRSDSDKVFVRKTNSCTDKEYVMYDYNLNSGDSAWFACFSCATMSSDTINIKIIGIDSVIVNGIQRKRMKTLAQDLSACVLDTADWLKGIGSTFNPFYSLDPLFSTSEVAEYTLLCFDSSTTQLYMNPIWNICDTTSTGINVLNTNESVEMNPNPAIEKITLRFQEQISSIEIYNSLGEIIYYARTVWMPNETIEIDLSNKTAGFYFLIAKSNRNNITQKFVKL